MSTSTFDTDTATRKDIALAVAEIKTDITAARGELALLKWMLGALLVLAVANFAKQYF